MARAIDAYTLNNDLVSWYNDTEDEKEKSILRRVMQRVVQAFTLAPPNEALTLEQLREMDAVEWHGRNPPKKGDATIIRMGSGFV